METRSQQPLIQPIVPSEANDRVNAIFKQIEENLGMVPDGLRLYAMTPTLLEAFITAATYFMRHNELNQVMLGFIRYLASDRIGCKFCISLNEGLLINLGIDLDVIRAVSNDIDKAPVTEREKALIAFAVKGVSEPEAVTAADMDVVRKVGWNDRHIFEVVAMAANTRAFNLVLKTFKVEEQGIFS